MRASAKVALFEDARVVRDVAGGDEGQGADGHEMIAGNAASPPRRFRQVPKQRKRRLPHVSKVVEVRGPRKVVRLGSCRGGLLLNAGKRRIESSTEPQNPEGEGALGVAHVIENLPDAPLSRSVAEQRALLGDGGETARPGLELIAQNGHGIVARNLVNVLDGIGGKFGRIRSSSHGINVNLDAVISWSPLPRTSDPR